MAFFPLRWNKKDAPEGGGKPARRGRGAAAQAETIEEMRRRARHRLVGAVVLVLAGVIGFPLLFDSQPRPVEVDVQLDIPDRNKVEPLPQAAAPAQVHEAPATGLDAGEELVDTAHPAPAVTAAPPEAPDHAEQAAATTKTRVPAEAPLQAPVAKAHEAAADAAPQPKAAAKPAPTDAERARALLEGRAPTAVAKAAPAASAGQRFIVQVGAFADADKAREVRLRLERAGVKTYAQVVDTSAGKRTRVRLGPFDSRAEAEKAAERVKGMGLAGSVLTL